MRHTLANLVEADGDVGIGGDETNVLHGLLPAIRPGTSPGRTPQTDIVPATTAKPGPRPVPHETGAGLE